MGFKYASAFTLDLELVKYGARSSFARIVDKNQALFW